MYQSTLFGAAKMLLCQLFNFQEKSSGHTACLTANPLPPLSTHLKPCQHTITNRGLHPSEIIILLLGRGQLFQKWWYSLFFFSGRDTTFKVGGRGWQYTPKCELSEGHFISLQLVGIEIRTPFLDPKQVEFRFIIFRGYTIGVLHCS